MELIDFEPRESHPFKEMEVGDRVKTSKRLQHYVHAYAANSGKKFHTKTVDGDLIVKRVK